MKIKEDRFILSKDFSEIDIGEVFVYGPSAPPRRYFMKAEVTVENTKLIGAVEMATGKMHIHINPDAKVIPMECMLEIKGPFHEEGRSQDGGNA